MKNDGEIESQREGEPDKGVGMSLIKCPECGREISDKAVACLGCGSPVNSKTVTIEGKVSPKTSPVTWGCIFLCIGFFLIVIVIVVCPSNASKQTSGANTHEAVLRTELKYLSEIAEVDWVEVEGNNVYVGFKFRPNDLTSIIRAAAFNGNKAINFGVHVWAVKASDRGWRPGDGPYYEEVTCRYGKISN